jgi:hypothetical protein
MDSLHERLARLALAAASGYGFCLAAGYAVQAHGFLDREQCLKHVDGVGGVVPSV